MFSILIVQFQCIDCPDFSEIVVDFAIRVMHAETDFSNAHTHKYTFHTNWIFPRHRNEPTDDAQKMMIWRLSKHGIQFDLTIFGINTVQINKLEQDAVS